MAGTVATEITAHLRSKNLSPSSAWLATFLTSIRPTTPLPALKQTALFRILASDLTNSLDHSCASIFPPDIQAAHFRERRLAGPIAVQVLGVEDIGRSVWSQIEALEALERGEGTKGREVVRVVPGEDGSGDGGETTEKSSGPHKLVLQDAKGCRIFGVETVSVNGVGLGMSIGTKMLLQDVLVARGVLLLDTKSAEVLGGKIEAMHQAWKDGRKVSLKAAVSATSG